MFPSSGCVPKARLLLRPAANKESEIRVTSPALYIGSRGLPCTPGGAFGPWIYFRLLLEFGVADVKNLTVPRPYQITNFPAIFLSFSQGVPADDVSAKLSFLIPIYLPLIIIGGLTSSLNPVTIHLKS